MRQILYLIIEDLIRNISGPLGIRIRRSYYQNRLKQCGKMVVIDTGVFFDKPKSIVLGDNVWIDKNSHFIAGKLENKKEEKINQDLNVLQGHIILGNYIHIGINTIIQGHGGVEIGDYFTSSSNCCIYTLSNDPFKCKYGTYNGNVRDVFYINSPVQIESNVWLGLGVIVLGGKIGTNSFIKPHSIITKSIPANSIAQGSPAERVKFRFTIKEEY